MTKQQIALATLPASLLFMFLAYAWPTSSPALSGWTDDDSKKHSEVAHQLHELAYGAHAHGPPQPGQKVHHETHEEEAKRKAQHAALKEKFNQEEVRLDRSRKSGAWIAGLLVNLSVITFVVGIGGIAYVSVIEQQGGQK